MRKIGSFIFSIVALLITSGMLVFGVLAAQSASFSLNNSILYSPTSAYVSIRAKVEGADESRLDQAERAELYKTFESDTTSPTPNTDLGTWELPTLNFITKDSQIVFTFNITNIGEKTVVVDIELLSTPPANTIDRYILKYVPDLGPDGLTENKQNPGEDESITNRVNKLIDDNPDNDNDIDDRNALLEIAGGETGAIRLVVAISENCTSNFTEISNNFKVIMTEKE